jgi:glyoxylase-like metal-dependent hydrolase (beta-lactamase superfamily II)
MKKIFLFTGFILLFSCIVMGIIHRKELASRMSVQVVQYDPQLKILFGGGGNSIILTSEDGSKALIVDTKMKEASRTVKENTQAKEITIVNTHLHHDHTGGNALFPQAVLIAGNYSKAQWEKATDKSRYPDQTVAIGEEKVLSIGSETVHVRNMGQAHTSNDVVVYLEKRRLLVTGDIVFISMHPVLLVQTGTRVDSWIKVLDTLDHSYQIEALIPGHGKFSDKKILLVMKDYFLSIGDSIGKPGKQALLKEKYKGYYSIPGMSGFEKTLAFIEKEKSGK